MEEVDANPALIFDKIDAWLDGFFRLLPNIGLAIVVFFVFWIVAKGVAGLIRRAAKNRDRPSLAEVGSTLVKWTIIVVGAMLAVTIVAPTLTPGDLIAGLGVSSVAIGFAFKDILQNMLAGILILLRQPFEVGDRATQREGWPATGNDPKPRRIADAFGKARQLNTFGAGLTCAVKLRKWRYDQNSTYYWRIARTWRGDSPRIGGNASHYCSG